MRATFSPTVKKIQRCSTLVLFVIYPIIALSVIAGIVLITSLITSPAIEVSNMATIIAANDGLNFKLGQLRNGLFTSTEKWTIVVIGTSSMCIYIYSLFFLKSLFENFKRGDIFCANSVAHARKLGKAVLALVLCMFVIELQLAFWAKDLNVSFPEDILKYLLVCALWVVIWIVEIGTELNTDDELTV